MILRSARALASLFLTNLLLEVRNAIQPFPGFVFQQVRRCRHRDGQPSRSELTVEPPGAIAAQGSRALRRRREPMKKVARRLRAQANLLMNCFKARGEISAGAGGGPEP